MDSSSQTGKKFSEKEMADAFQAAMESNDGFKDIGPFDGIYREVNCHQGRPDFIALKTKQKCTLNNLSESIGFVGSSILSQLKPKSPRTLDYLIKKSEFSEQSVRRSLSKLVAIGYSKRTDKGSFILGEKSCFLGIEVWAFELKLKDPKRAIFQAQQSRAYAEYSIIVIPPGQERNYSRFTGTLTRWGIGLATFEPYDCNFVIIRKPKKSRAFSRQHQIYALNQLYTGKMLNA